MDRYIMKKNAMFAAGVSLFIGSLALAGEVWVTNDISPVNSSDFIWSSAAPTSADTWLVSGPDSLPDAVYNIDTALEFAGLSVGSDGNSTIKLVSGGSLALGGDLSMSADSKLKLELAGGSLSLGAFTYASSNPLSVSGGSSLSSGNFILNDSSALFSGAPAGGTSDTLSVNGYFRLNPAQNGSVTKALFADGATATMASLSLNEPGTRRDNSSSILEVGGGSKVTVSGGTTRVWASGQDASTGIIVSGAGSSVEFASGSIQVTARNNGTATGERAFIEVSDGAQFKSQSIEFWTRANLSNTSELIVKGGSTAEVGTLLFRPNEPSNNVAGSAYVKVQGSGNVLKSTGTAELVNDLGLDAVVSIELDAGNEVIFNRINMKQYTTAARNAETGAFEQGSRFLFSCDEDGYVSTVGLSDSTATMTLESYIDLDFSNLILGEGESVTTYLFMGYYALEGFASENVYLTFDGKNYYALDSDGKFANSRYEFELINEDSILGYSLSYVPEPSACAAVFGALALAFAAYLRRRN